MHKSFTFSAVIFITYSKPPKSCIFTVHFTVYTVKVKKTVKKPVKIVLSFY